MSKYDWSNVPDSVQWIATDEDGWAWGWTGMPKIGRYNAWTTDGDSCLTGYHVKPNNCENCRDWENSLEERPEC